MLIPKLSLKYKLHQWGEYCILLGSIFLINFYIHFMYVQFIIVHLIYNSTLCLDVLLIYFAAYVPDQLYMYCPYKLEKQATNNYHNYIYNIHTNNNIFKF